MTEQYHMNSHEGTYTREFEAEVIGKHEQTDLAVLKIKADNLNQVEMGDSD